MKVRISIEKVQGGYDFHNAKAWDYPVVATIRESKNKPGVYLWRIYDEGKSGFSNLDGAIGRVKLYLTQIAVERLGGDIEFITA